MKRVLGAIAMAAGILGAAAAQAQGGTVARLVDVSGNVLVSNDFNIASANEAVRLAPGTRVLVTSNSAVIVEYDNGCRVRLTAGERLEIRGDARCSARPIAAGVVYAPVLSKR